MNKTSNSTSMNNNNIISIINYFDNLARCIVLISHMIYFIIVILLRDFQKLSYFNMHHTNFIGLLSGILYCAWINQSIPSFSNKTLNDLLCSLSEFCWPVFRYARSYSLLVLAIYRYMAVFHNKFFKKFSLSFKYNLFVAALAWVMSILVFLISKYSLSTKPSSVMCVDGTASSLQISIIYYLITSLPAYVIPSVLVIIAYVLINQKIKSLSKSLTRTSQTIVTNNRKNAKESKLALQLILLNLFNIITIISLMLIALNRWLPVLEKNFYFLRQIWRVVNNLSQSVIPFLSVIFHPKKLNFKNNIFCSKIQSSGTITSKSLW